MNMRRSMQMQNLKNYEIYNRNTIDISSRAPTYPLDIINIKMSVQRKLFDPVREIPLKTGNNFPTRTLHQHNVMTTNISKNQYPILFR